MLVRNQKQKCDYLQKTIVYISNNLGQGEQKDWESCGMLTLEHDKHEKVY